MEHTGGFGTFAYPDPSIGRDGYEAYLQRLWAMPISERMLSNADFLYDEWRSATIRERLEAELAHRLNPGGDVDAAIQRYKASTRTWTAQTITQEFLLPAEREARTRIAAEVGPEEMPRSQIATIVRAAQACRLNGLLPPEERQYVYTHEVMAGDELISLLDLRDRYHASEWVRDALVDSDLRVAAAMNRAADAFLSTRAS